MVLLFKNMEEAQAPCTGPAARVRRRGSTGALPLPFMQTVRLDLCRLLRLGTKSSSLPSSS